MTAIPTVTPTPMPAFAPEFRPPSLVSRNAEEDASGESVVCVASPWSDETVAVAN